MKTLHFVRPIRFEILEVIVYPKVCHLVGRFLTGKFRNERRLRAELDDRWWGAKNHIIELPGHELREVKGACGRMGRRNFYRPIYTSTIYVMPLEVDAFKFNDVKVLTTLKRSQCSAPQGMSDGIDNSQELKDAIAVFQAFKKSMGSKAALTRQEA